MVKTGEGSHHILHLRLTCVMPPTELCGNGLAEFGLQDRKQTIHIGQLHPDGSVSYEIDVPVTYFGETNALHFRGPYVHGTPSAPFLYLSQKRLESGPSLWIRRLKIPLSGITWEQIESDDEISIFSARISGTGSGTVPLLDGGWTRQYGHH